MLFNILHKFINVLRFFYTCFNHGSHMHVYTPFMHVSDHPILLCSANVLHMHYTGIIEFYMFLHVLSMCSIHILSMFSHVPHMFNTYSTHVIHMFHTHSTHDTRNFVICMFHACSWTLNCSIMIKCQAICKKFHFFIFHILFIVHSLILKYAFVFISDFVILFF